MLCGVGGWSGARFDWTSGALDEPIRGHYTHNVVDRNRPVCHVQKEILLKYVYRRCIYVPPSSFVPVDTIIRYTLTSKFEVASRLDRQDITVKLTHG